jgi:hypothetical protein
MKSISALVGALALSAILASTSLAQSAPKGVTPAALRRRAHSCPGWAAIAILALWPPLAGPWRLLLARPSRQVKWSSSIPPDMVPSQ